MSYEYNEAEMLRGIRAYREETKAKVVIERRPVSSASPVGKAVISCAAAMFRIKPVDILSKRQERPLVRAREVVVLVLRKKYTYSTPRIGSILNRHHTTILNLERLATKHYAEHDEFRRVVNEVAGVDLSTIRTEVTIKRDEMGIPKRTEAA